MTEFNKIDMTAYLERAGWVRSYEAQQVIDADGSPIPWFCYPAIDLIKERVPTGINVFEWGCGYGTLWWATRARLAFAVEHDRKWLAKMRERAPRNARIIYSALEYDGAYCRVIGKLHKKFHIIVIDGRDRNNCARHAVSSLTEDGVIIWDNSERESYAPGQEELRQQGFTELRLHGPVALYDGEISTSFFYRPNNCLAL